MYSSERMAPTVRDEDTGNVNTSYAKNSNSADRPVSDPILVSAARVVRR